jgi:hypothetical protein
MKKNYQVKGDSNNGGQTSLNELNQNIDFIYNIIAKNFKESMLKTRFEFKKEILTTLIFNNSSISTKKIKIESNIIQNLLINLRRAIKIKIDSNSGSINLLNNTDYRILDNVVDKVEGDDLNSEKPQSKRKAEKDTIKKITLFINTKYLQNYKGFIKRLIVKENSSSFLSDENELFRCNFCSSILPKMFIKMTDESKNTIIKAFNQKAQKCWEYTMVFRHPKFLKSIQYDDIEKLMEQLTNLSVISETKIADTSKRMKSFLETSLQKVQNQNNNILDEFTKDVIKHVRMQIKHYNKIKKLDRIINDIDDATREYNTKTELLKNDLSESIDYLKNIQEFQFKNTDLKNDTEKLKSELTINSKSIDRLEKKDLKFKQVCGNFN